MNTARPWEAMVSIDAVTSIFLCARLSMDLARGTCKEEPIQNECRRRRRTHVCSSMKGGAPAGMRHVVGKTYIIPRSLRKLTYNCSTYAARASTYSTALGIRGEQRHYAFRKDVRRTIF
jgi:hypothetical protein